MNCNFKTTVNAELDNHKLIHKVKKKREKTTLNIKKTRIVKMKTKIIEIKVDPSSSILQPKFVIVHDVKKPQKSQTRMGRK